MSLIALGVSLKERGFSDTVLDYMIDYRKAHGDWPNERFEPDKILRAFYSNGSWQLSPKELNDRVKQNKCETLISFELLSRDKKSIVYRLNYRDKTEQMQINDDGSINRQYFYP